MLQKSIKTNIIFNIINQVLQIIIPLIISPYISRTMGVEAIGIYSFSLTIANYFRRFSHLGMDKYGNRSIVLVAEKDFERRKAFWNIYFTQAISSLICIAIYILLIAFTPIYKEAIALQAVFVISALFDVSWYFYGKENFRIVVITSLFFKIIYLVSTLLLIKSSADIYIYILIAALSYLAPNVVIFILALVREKFIVPELKEIKKVFKGTLILFVPVIAVTLYKSVDKLMLGWICETAYQNGIYENAEKVLNVPLAVIGAISGVMMPRMTSLFQRGDNETAMRYISYSAKFSAFISIACTFGILGVSGLFSVIYWGEEFWECANLLNIFAFSIPFMSIAEIIRSQIIIPKERDATYLIAVCLGFVSNLAINLLLIPSYGASGAAIGTVIAEFIVCAYHLFSVRHQICLKGFLGEYLKFLLPGIAMFAIIYMMRCYLKGNVVSLFAMIGIGGIVYMVLSFLMLIIFDRKFILSLFHRIKR